MTAKKEPEVLRFIVANGALLEAPVWERHHRGSNWLAVIDVDGTAPGGFSRRFINRGRGACLYLTEQLGLFDALEFAADYTTLAGNKQRDRWFGVVKAITEDFILVEKTGSGVLAVLRAKALRISAADRAAALRIERETLLDRAAKLEEEAQQLETSKEEPKEAEAFPNPDFVAKTCVILGRYSPKAQPQVRARPEEVLDVALSVSKMPGVKILTLVDLRDNDVQSFSWDGLIWRERSMPEARKAHIVSTLRAS